MKILIIVSTLPLLIAANWIPVSFIQSGKPQGAGTLEQCVQTFKETCLDVGETPGYVELGAYTVDTTILKQNTLSCESIEDCDAKFVSFDFNCPSQDWEKIKNYELLEVYCIKPDVPVLVTNQAIIDAHLAEKAAQQAIAAIEAQGAKAKQDCDRVLNLIRGFNLQPGRTVSQTDQMQTTFAPIESALNAGRPGVAKALIQQIQPDEVLVTSQMKSLVLDVLKDW